MDVIKAKNLGINIKVFKESTGGFKDSFAGIFNKPGLINSFWVLRGVSFTVSKGEPIAVIGRSGSGKSTLLQAISGMCPLDEGSLEILGTVSPLLTSTIGFHRDLSGIQNIYLYGENMRIEKREIDTLLDGIVSLADIGDFINRPVRTYSSQMMLRLGFSIAVNFKRDILLIDEALEAGDLKFKRESEAKLKDIISDGKTIVLISHHMDTIRRFASRVLWLEDGRLIAQGDTKNIINQYRK